MFISLTSIDSVIRYSCSSNLSLSCNWYLIFLSVLSLSFTFSAPLSPFSYSSSFLCPSLPSIIFFFDLFIYLSKRGVRGVAGGGGGVIAPLCFFCFCLFVVVACQLRHVYTVKMRIPLPHYGNNFGTTIFGRKKKCV